MNGVVDAGHGQELDATHAGVAGKEVHVIIILQTSLRRTYRSRRRWWSRRAGRELRHGGPDRYGIQALEQLPAAESRHSSHLGQKARDVQGALRKRAVVACSAIDRVLQDSSGVEATTCW